MTKDGSAPAMDSMQLIASLFALLPVPVAVSDENGGIVIFNSSFAEAFPRYVSTSGMFQREVHSPGHGTFELHTLPLNDQGFKIVYATDVSAQRQLGQQLSELEKMASIGRVFTGIAQELNEAVFTNSERAGQLVQNVMVLAGTKVSQHVPFDLNEIVRNVTVQRAAHNVGSLVNVTVDLESNLPRTLGYPSQIEQVIVSLLAHAEDAVAGTADGHGSIQVQTGRRAGRVLVQIADDGMSRDSVRIFTPGSAGVGLNVCAEIAKDHGGDLYAWNANGNGSTFTLELPVFGPESVRISNSVQLERLLQNKSVMVVDDEVRISELIYDVLKRHGANVQVAGSSLDACERLSEKEYDLIICGQTMRGLSGQSLFRLLTSENPDRHSLFLFLAGDVITAEARQFYSQSGVQYLRKPFRIQDLVEAVEGLLSRNLPPGC